MQRVWVLFSFVAAFLTFTVSLDYFQSDVGDFRNFRKISSRYSVYEEKIQPLFDKRCVACHACFNSPCQLNLTSYEGLSRGATKDAVYDLARFSSTKPTRIFWDEKSDNDWRDRGFFSVIHPPINEQKKQKTILELMVNDPETEDESVLAQKQEISFISEEDNYCASHDYITGKSANKRRKKRKTEVESFLNVNPLSKMPFGFPAIEKSEYETLMSWIEEGARGPNGFRGTQGLDFRLYELSSELKDKVRAFENLLNGPSNKDKLSSRYIYEKLFLGHLYFEDYEPTSGEDITFFRLVRSQTKTGLIYELPTTRPYDKVEGGKFYYRLAPLRETLVHKTHITYALSDKKMKRYRELFYDAKWKVFDVKLPPYGKKSSSNPFITFAQIPAKSRYQFMLDNAQFIVMSFIRGPVCKGQVAVNVIDDHFWVTFIDPEKDPFIKNNERLKEIAPYMSQPASHGSKFKGFGKFYKNQVKYRELRAKAYEESEALTLDHIWDGDGHNKNAFLTVYRHFDSATVIKGHRGFVPKTVWTMDYPIFEDIFYNLVAGYNVFEALPHHLKSRLYMEYSRINSQDTFISFLPKEIREKVRNSWTMPAKKSKPGRFTEYFYKHLPDYLLSSKADLKMKYRYPYLMENVKTEIKFQNDAYSDKAEFLNSIWLRNQDLLIPDYINCCEYGAPEVNTIESFEDFNLALKSISSKKGKYPKYFPDLSFIKVNSEDGDKAYTLIHNKAHYNVSYMFSEGNNLRPEDDTLHFHEGFVGSYPNFFFEVELDQAQEFISDVKGINSEESYQLFIKKYGVSRHNKGFWNVFDFFTEEFKRIAPIEAGIFDLNRYENY
ncbi:MAG: hypothetical protein GY909_03760 [Oligoflexia bacterium]|nr:hypothetical protein [Oligoflexia bacterium]